MHLRDLKQGLYNVMAAKEYMTHFGQSGKLLLELDCRLHGVLSNRYIANTIETTQENKLRM